MSRCRDCGRQWTGGAECHCAGCCEHFGSVTAFDRHQADGRCRDPRDVKGRDGSPRLFVVERRHGPTWVTKLRGPERLPHSSVVAP